uniref:Uncharacterized protein n=1 Tax=Aegilops tauschii subsp. strangulata TaxID=200361 RepID=A0A453K6V0_AEGTS
SKSRVDGSPSRIAPTIFTSTAQPAKSSTHTRRTPSSLALRRRRTPLGAARATALLPWPLMAPRSPAPQLAPPVPCPPARVALHGRYWPPSPAGFDHPLCSPSPPEAVHHRHQFPFNTARTILRVNDAPVYPTRSFNREGK